MKKRRSVLRAEQLEARQLLDASLWAGTEALRTPVLPAAQRTFPAEAVTDPGQPPCAAADRPLACSLPLQELESFFAQPEELEKLFDNPAPERFLTRPSDGGLAAWRFLRGYTEKAIRNFEARFGALPDREDLVHQVFVEWWEQVGSDDSALVNLLQRDSPARETLRKVVPRVLSRARYEQNKQARRAEPADLPARSDPQDWLDLRLDLEAGVGRLETQERQLLDLRRQGKTFDEIAPEMGMSKQRASERCQAILTRLQEVYA